ncbi:MAG TPA: DUF6152 family protein [Gammaproteobacteria bacterium]|nr:DUF6152 family protein [Gammaproteobacteria bacterium]
MRSRPATTAAALALVCAGSVQAHHSHLGYQTTPIWISGTVTRFELKNPHAITTLEGRTENGQVVVWTVEGPSQTELNRRGGSDEYLPKVGDTLEVCAYPYRPVAEIASDPRLVPYLDDSILRRLEATTAEGASPRLILGHLLLATGGAMRVWEPYGSIGECMRSSHEPRESWIEKLNANREARKIWCDQRGRDATQSNAALTEFVEQTNALLVDPCQ